MADWRPGISPDNLRLRARLLGRARKFFSERDVMEVETPLLGACGVTDPTIESFVVPVSDGERYLQTSPEFAMKRLLAFGVGDIYQICKSFRASESGVVHNPEFTLIEWYRLGYSLQQMMRETADFVGMLLTEGKSAKPITYLKYSDAGQHIFGETLQAMSKARLEHLAVSSGLVVGDSVSRNQLYDFLFSNCVVPTFDSNCITVITHYPASQASLARLDEENPELAQRFEVFSGGLELANGFVELTDPHEQLDRFIRDREQRSDSGLFLPEIDQKLISALQSGLPDCAGVAVGFDRVAMLAAGVQSIDEVISFGWERI